METPVAKTLIETYGFTQAELDSVCWNRLYKEKALIEFLELVNKFAEIMEPQNVACWFRSAHQNFNFRTPLFLIQFGEIDLIWDIYWNIASGSPS